MLKKIIHKVLGTTAHSRLAKPQQSSKRVEVPVAKHKIDRSLIDPRAIDVVETLQEGGFEAYLVGGAVRDLLLGIRPKDFDIATDATPEEVKRLFKRAFIIGKRFRIVHVVYGRGREHEVFEVSTFRAMADAQQTTKIKGSERSRRALEGLTHAVDSGGRILRDNVWGDIASDARRRDFTINAMYYDPGTEVVVDYHNGIADAKKRVIRMIGEPQSRYREDPVRMIRAVRFMAKLSDLGFKLDADTRAPIKVLKELLSDVPPSRLFDEMMKLLQTGHALQSLKALEALGISEAIDPLLALIHERKDEPMIAAALRDTDARVQAGKSVAPSFLLACVLWQDVCEGWRMQQTQMPSYPALMAAIDDVFAKRVGDISGRGKLSADMREIWSLQPRFEKRVGSSPMTLAAHLRFRAAYDFLCLRAAAAATLNATTDATTDAITADAAVPLQDLVAWWEAFQHADEPAREEMIQAVKAAGQRKAATTSSSGGRGRRPRRTRAPGNPDERA